MAVTMAATPHLVQVDVEAIELLATRRRPVCLPDLLLTVLAATRVERHVDVLRRIFRRSLSLEWIGIPVEHDLFRETNVDDRPDPVVHERRLAVRSRRGGVSGSNQGSPANVAAIGGRQPPEIPGIEETVPGKDARALLQFGRHGQFRCLGEVPLPP